MYAAPCTRGVGEHIGNLDEHKKRVYILYLNKKRCGYSLYNFVGAIAFLEKMY